MNTLKPRQMRKRKRDVTCVGKQQPRDPNTMHYCVVPETTFPEYAAKLMVEGLASNTLASRLFSNSLLPTVDVTEAFAQTLEAVAKVMKGDLGGLQAMLAAQALTCNAVFTDCMSRARLNYQNPEVFNRYMRSGLRAQSQSRATVETIAVTQNPPTVFAKQANITNGPQQVNNTLQTDAAPRVCAPTIDSSPIKLLELRHDGQRLDTEPTSRTTESDSPLAAVEAINGATKRPRKSAGVAKRIQGRQAAAASRRDAVRARAPRSTR